MGAPFDLSSYLWPDAALRRQPQNFVPIDWSNPLTRGLAFAFVGSTGVDHVSGKSGALVSGTALSAYTKAGVGMRAGSAADSVLKFTGIDGGLSACPDLSGIYISEQPDMSSIGTSATRRLCYYGSDDATIQSQFFVGCYALSANEHRQYYAQYNTTTGLAGYTADAQGLVAGVPCGFTYAGGAVQFYTSGLANGVNSVLNMTRVASNKNLWLFCGPAVGTDKGWTAPTALLLLWSRPLSASEHRALALNPWQVFVAPPFLAYLPAVSLQYARPTSDTSAGTWTSFPSGTLASCIDETAVDTGDYITTLNASTCEVQLGAISDPGVLTGHGLDYELSANTGTIKVRLRNNGATIKEWVHSPAPSSPTLYNQTLNTTEAGTINWSFPLSLQFEAI